MDAPLRIFSFSIAFNLPAAPLWKWQTAEATPQQTTFYTIVFVWYTKELKHSLQFCVVPITHLSRSLGLLKVMKVGCRTSRKTQADSYHLCLMMCLWLHLAAICTRMIRPIVFLAAIFSLVTQCSSPQTVAHIQIFLTSTLANHHSGYIWRELCAPK